MCAAAYASLAFALTCTTVASSTVLPPLLSLPCGTHVEGVLSVLVTLMLGRRAVAWTLARDACVWVSAVTHGTTVFSAGNSVSVGGFTVAFSDGGGSSHTGDPKSPTATARGGTRQ